VARIWRLTPSLADIADLVADEPIVEFGRRSRVFPGVDWSYEVTVHTLLDTGLVVAVVAAFVTLGLVYRQRVGAQRAGAGLAGPIGSWSLVSLVGTTTGAACCGAVPVSLLGVGLGATAPVVYFLNTYQGPLIGLGYAILIGNVVYAGYRLHQVDASTYTPVPVNKSV